MAFSKITITFNEDLGVNNYVSFTLLDDVRSSVFTQVWKQFRQGANQVAVSVPTSIAGEASAISYAQTFDLDYNSGNIYNITRVLNKVTIEILKPDIDFANGVSDANVTFITENSTVAGFSFISVSYIQAANPCTHVKLRVETNLLAVDVKVGSINYLNNTLNPFFLDTLRSGGVIPQSLGIGCVDADGQRIFTSIQVPNTLAAENTSVSINPSPNGSTVLVFVNNSSGLDLQYSLDGNTWSVDSNFDSLPEGDYTLHVKDQLGCLITKNFVVTAFGSTESHLYISSSNSVRMVEYSKGGNRTNLKIDKNRFAHEDEVKEVKSITQVFNYTDIITQQFQSNYETLHAKVVGSDLVEIELPINKMSENMGLNDARDCFIFDYGSGKTGAYFTTGKTYNFDTLIYTGINYTLNGGLPEWGLVGEYVKLGSLWLQIEDVVFDEFRFAEVLVLGVPFSGVERSQIISTIYNRENYEVYEYNMYMNTINSDRFEVQLSNKNSNEDEVLHVSECCVVGDTSNYKEIRYYNDTNTDVLYATGIEHKLWLRTERVDNAPIGESELHSTDNTTIQLNASIKPSKKFEFEAIPSALMSKLFTALHHRKLYIDGVKYVLSDTPEVEGAIEDSNLYKLTASLIESNEFYNSKSSDIGVPNMGQIVEIPALISIDTDGYIKI